MPLLSLLRTPTSEPGRRYSYHRAILLAAGAVVLYLMRPAVPSPEVVETHRWVATAVLGIAVVGLLVAGAEWVVRGRRRRRPGR